MRLLLLLWAVLLAGAFAATAHPPLPESVTRPQTAAEAWNVLRLATANAGQLLREHRLSEVPDQVALCGPALRLLPQVAATPGDLAARSVEAVGDMGAVAQAALVGDEATALRSLARLRTAMECMQPAFDPATVRAEIYACPMHPDFLSPDARALCRKCEMELLIRRIPYSFVYTRPGQPSIHLEARPPAQLRAGEPATVRLRLTQSDGTPVRPEDLLIVHTQRIHLLLVEPTLSDYHHEHPMPTGTPGEYTFSFTPRRDDPYRVFADLVPAANGVQEYPWLDLPGAAPATGRPDPAEVLASTSHGLSFKLSWADAETTPLRAATTRPLRLTVTCADGTPATHLEPVMNAFAHLVGFYDDYQTVVHLHPAGGEITLPSRRGGPALDFLFYPPRAGLLKLFAQVQVEGQAIFAPFTIRVE